MLLDLLMGRRRNQMYLENSREKSTNAFIVMLAPAQLVYFSLIFNLILIVNPILFTIPTAIYLQCE